eukprot:TRINITY_DN10373_c0_g3_i2.p1 TRINITY_DN10373_c0_g3~~TRINITY_DN10373_c0_g3_i2.p1  ORF type:complete len:661 (+),score=103.35 TRINITY_DN10373_c0_g3_i2:83-2065(+)
MASMFAVGHLDVSAALQSQDAPHLWEPVRGLDACESCTTLQKVRRQACVTQLKRYFEETGCLVTLGFNPGSGDVSFTLKPQVGNADTVPETVRGAVALGMLGLLRSSDTTDVDPNACLDLWTASTLTAFIDRRYNAASSAVTVVVKAYEDCVAPSAATFSSKTAKHKAIRYSPSFRLLDEGAGVGSVVDLAVAELWHRIRSSNYVPARALYEALTPRLRELLLSGFQGVLDRFCTDLDRPCGVYLIGEPGTGKSSFVEVFSAALEVVVTKYLASTQKVAVVKVPLNAVTQETLKKQALIKGLSDHSIERIVEQTLCQGHLVLLHLEENPEDTESQLCLNAVVESILGKLAKRYPGYETNIITFCTSNHPMAPALTQRYGTPVPIAAPGLDERERWMERQLAIACPNVDIHVDGFPQTPDMRHLVQWCLSLSHHLRLAALVGTPAGGHADPHATRYVKVRKTAEASGSWSVEGVSGDVLLRLETPADSLFCYNAEGVGDEAAAVAAQIDCVLEMTKVGLLSPAVVVIRGGEADARCQRLKALVNERAASFFAKVVSTDIRLLEKCDAKKVFGEAHEIRGGLFKFIDDHTCANSPTSFSHVVVTATVSEAGQFILRELLEQGEKSRTHRLAVAKAGCLFVLVLQDPEDAITPQVYSRAHLLL